LRFHSNNQNFTAEVEKAGIEKLEPLVSPHTLYPNQLPPGAGMTQFVLNDLGDFPWAVLCMFTGTGDNFTAAHYLAHAASQIMNLDRSSPWITPKSWNALYNAENQNYVNDQEIYT
jgi:hypothetical protein